MSPPTKMMGILRWVRYPPSLENLPLSEKRVTADSVSTRFHIRKPLESGDRIFSSVSSFFDSVAFSFSTKGRVLSKESLIPSGPTPRRIWFQTPGKRSAEHAIRFITNNRRMALNHHE